METDEHNVKKGQSWLILPPYLGSLPDKADVPACPECKSTKFVAAMVNESDGITECVSCENGHAWHPDELLRLHISEALRADNYTGEAMGHTVNVWINEFWTEIGGSTDRAVAILSGAMLDEILVVLLSALAIDERLLTDRLLKPDRPLGSFGARIDACYLFGLISEREWRALRLVKDIRNAFAHRLANLSFKDTSMKDRTRGIFEALQISVPNEVDERKLFGSAINALWSPLVGKISLVRRVARMPHDPSFAMTMHHALRSTTKPSAPPAA